MNARNECLCFALKVGLLDIDLCGPSIPYLLNLEDRDGESSVICIRVSEV